MSNANAELKYDPEFPYVVFNDSSEVPVARFISDVLAADFALNNQYRRVIDTTPKPKIPEDAEFIHYLDSGGEDQFGHRGIDPEGNEIWWTGGGHYSATKNLLEYIGDDEVTVLVRKEDS